PKAPRTHPVLLPRAVHDLVPGQRIALVSRLRQQLAGLAVAIEIHQKGKLHVESGIDRMLGPPGAGGPELLSGILPPHDALPKPAYGDDVREAVATDIDRDI